MKTNKILTIFLGALMAVACSDFDEINTNPQAVNEKDVKPYWALNKSIISDQQNPNDAERVFVLYWADIARQDGENSGRAVGRSNDEWAGCLYSLTGNCIKYADLCQDLSDKNASGEHEKAFYPNLKAFAKIWKVYLMTEFVDSFGAMPTDFSEINPEFKSVKDVYTYMYGQLEEAVKAIDVNVTPESAEQLCDPAYAYDAAKWKNFGISMWMRIAMRLSEVDPATAKAQFEKAVAAGSGIVTTDGTFRVQERTGWDDLSGVMTRSWDWQELSMTMANLMTNLGGVDALELVKDPGHNFYATPPTDEEISENYAPYVKDASKYLGVVFKGVTSKGEMSMTEGNTDSPTIGYFFDGLPSKIDPRSFAYYTLPTDANNAGRVWQGPSFMIPDPPKTKMYITKETTDDAQINIKLAFNGLPCGVWYDDPYNNYCNFSDGYGIAYPALTQRYRASTENRVFFGPWETYFLKAEAALKGWNAGMSAEDAYYAGIKANLEYLGLGSFYESYVNSEGYNRVGTSVKFSHTAEPADYEIEVLDAQSGETKKVTYHYPVASKCLYTEGLNTKLAKILTQKYIANTPWLPLENWSDHRRTGLPFWEMPLGSTEFPFLDGWTTESYKNGQKVGYYAQRMNYPAKFSNADPEGYKKAIALMGMDSEKTITPLWWAKGSPVK